ncbi:hypothetical protein AC792_01130 [Arthrobacter sp. RIT-PI-e]|nr:hypothetical protein AC792_01130 [Arthrobacter sp. RIT-PI-e]
MVARPDHYKRVITGGGLGVPGFSASISTALVPTDAKHCQVLVDVIDDKDAFVMHPDREVGARVFVSIEEVRKLAVSTQSLVESVEAMEEARNIATACRTFMREYKEGDDPRVLAGILSAMRADVGESVAFLVQMLGLRPPSRFDVSPFEQRALDVLAGWLNRPA